MSHQHELTRRSIPLLALLVCCVPLRAQSEEARRIEPRSALRDVIIHINQVACDTRSPKFAIVESAQAFPHDSEFQVVESASNEIVYKARLSRGQVCDDWFPGRHFYRATFSSFRTAGRYFVQIQNAGERYESCDFEIGEQELARQTIPAIIEYYRHQRADSPEELKADKHLLLFGSHRRVDLHGGWCDASGDVSKYFSHLAYTNFMSPQQTPLVVWSMTNAIERAGPLLEEVNCREPLQTEAVYGADYLLRSLSPEGYFYMTIFSYFKQDPTERRVVGLLADSKTTSDYQCAYREGGGMAIAALARIACLQLAGEFAPKEYLAGAERAFAHLESNNLKYVDDGKENIIDDYCALLAATELWRATNKDVYRDAARKRAANLTGRMSAAGYFVANDADRPFWHASDAGLPVVALARYLDQETDAPRRNAALETIRHALDYYLRVTNEVDNPFGYARQTFKLEDAIRDGFFIPHENESGWWWQGENARLASLSTAAIVGGRLVYPGDGDFGIKQDLADFAGDQINWIMGANPYDVCFMYDVGEHNVPYMAAMFGHGTGRGGISNGITGKDGNPDGSGIEFRFQANGNEWRWTEQWIPHSAWFLQAMTAISESSASPDIH